jgi:Ca2+-binding RTX toxin-like protein
VNQFGTPTFEFSYSIDHDSQGNLYNAGWTYGSLGGPNAGQEDAWLAKTRLDGTREWIRQFGTSGADGLFIGGLEIDSQDNIFVTGYTNGSLGGLNAGSFDAWVARYDTNGNQVWIQQFGTSESDYATNLAVDNSGKVYITGFTEGSLGGINNGAVDAWIAKFDAVTGSLLDFNGNGGNGDHSGNGGNGCNNPCPTNECATTPDNTVDALTGNNPSLVGYGSDTLTNYTDNGDRVLYGTAGDESLVGSTGNNVIYANEDNNTVKVGSGNDTIYSGASEGNSTPSGGNNTLYGTAGDDILTGGEGNNTIYSSEGNNTITTGAGNDTIYGGAGKDIINAGAGTNLIYAGEGDNIIYGGQGNNTIYTGSGHDLFVLGAGGTNLIMNFEVGKDLLGLTNGLTFEQLSITQGTNNNEFFTQVANGDDILATLNWVHPDAITSSSFAVV